MLKECTEIKMIMNNNYSRVVPPVNTREEASVWVAIFLCLVIVTGAVFAAESLSDADKQLKIYSMQAGYKKKFPGVVDFSADQILQLRNRNLIIFVDTRGQKEQTVSMIPGAITEKDFLQNPLVYKNHIVIAYCTIGLRSCKLAQKFTPKGIAIFNLYGGILAWLHAGGSVHKDGNPVNRVHVYGRKWNLAPAAMKSVW